jgi:translocation and assembly module TamB
VRRFEFELRGVDAAIFLTELGFENISASGVFDGVLPVEFSGLGGQIVGGRLIARAGGGHVAYVGELSNYNLGTMANFAFNMLKSLQYEAMEIGLNGELDGEMLTDVKITGLSQGEGASRNLITRQLEKLPIEFNVKINAPFRQLISSAKSLYDPSVLIDQNLFQLIEAQRARQQAPVQPRESETVP